jgi:vacuolar-type H+-ATPase subunit H
MEAVQRKIADREDEARASALEQSRELEEDGAQEAKKILDAARQEMNGRKPKRRLPCRLFHRFLICLMLS